MTLLNEYETLLNDANASLTELDGVIAQPEWCQSFFGTDGDIPTALRTYDRGEYDPVNQWAKGTTFVVAGISDYLDVIIYVNFPATTTITRVKMTVEQRGTSNGGASPSNDEYYRIAKILPAPTAILKIQIGPSIHGPDTFQVDTGSISVPTTQLMLRATVRYPDNNIGLAYCRITRLEICGMGVNPFV